MLEKIKKVTSVAVLDLLKKTYEGIFPSIYIHLTWLCFRHYKHLRWIVQRVLQQCIIVSLLFFICSHSRAMLA